jgi:hypothetical protein
MGAIMEEIRRRLLMDLPDGTFPQVKFNFNCNPFVRNSDAKKGGHVMHIIDILFADDSVFYVIVNICDDMNIMLL